MRNRLAPLLHRASSWTERRARVIIRCLGAVLAALFLANFAVLIVYVAKTNQLSKDNKDLILRVAATTHRVAATTHLITQTSLDARYHDCLDQDGLRQSLYDQAYASARTTPLLFQLVPSLDTPQVRRLAADSRSQRLKTYKPRGVIGCTAKALAAVPAAERASYRVP